MKAIEISRTGAALQIRMMLTALTGLSVELRKALLSLASVLSMGVITGVALDNTPMTLFSIAGSTLILLLDEFQKGGEK